MPLSKTSRSASRALLLAATAALGVAVLVLTALAAPALAKGDAGFHRGGLPSIGEISLKKVERGRVQISVPITYTRALAGRPRGLESSRVTLHIAKRLKRGRAVGTGFESSRRHRIHSTGTIVDRFTLTPRPSRWLLGRSAELRGQLVRVDVEHLIKERRGERPLHEKDASLTMAFSHGARPQGLSGIFTLANGTDEPIESVATPVLCMYTNGEWGSNLQAFSTNGQPILPGGTIEQEIEADGSILSDAEYEGETSPFAFDALGAAAEVIGTALDAELAPLVAVVDLADHCEAAASTFSIVVANANGNAASSEAWVLTDENCEIGCPRSHFLSAYQALGFQHPGELNENEIWDSASTEVLELFAGHYYPTAPTKGWIVQDDGLEFEWGEHSKHAWEATVKEGSNPSLFSG